ncbi:hypothetical protein SBF1_9680001 [Candidatus Desulfosporosinus infrequens]|uniref:Uncharacterized protein n=1 Tax=Candidatus Desulfosporosinus infrequens TaxID=2043169 RepID=A0A2U3LYR7_9FIRM|nr:hypothetical protein SBF1_9680001 [Candidatus Desulfosporosinus infrequens]
MYLNTQFHDRQPLCEDLVGEYTRTGTSPVMSPNPLPALLSDFSYIILIQEINIDTTIFLIEINISIMMKGILLFQTVLPTLFILLLRH